MTNTEPDNIIHLPPPPTHVGFTVLAIGDVSAPDNTYAHLLQVKGQSTLWRIFRSRADERTAWQTGQDVWVKRVDSEGKILAWHELGVTVSYLIE